jgi:hypothetical protein
MRVSALGVHILIIVDEIAATAIHTHTQGDGFEGDGFYDDRNVLPIRFNVENSWDRRPCLRGPHSGQSFYRVQLMSQLISPKDNLMHLFSRKSQ